MKPQKHASAINWKTADLQRLVAGLHQTRDARVYQRFLALQLLAEGWSVPAVSQLLHRSRQSVYNWRKRYGPHHCLQGLQERPRSGRPRTAAHLTQARLVRELKHCPLDQGYAATTWTVALLAGHLRHRYGWAITERTLRRRLKQLKWSWKRPRYVYADKDPHGARKKGRFSAACDQCLPARSWSPKTKQSSGSFPRCARLGARAANPWRCPSPAATPAGSCRERST